MSMTTDTPADQKPSANTTDASLADQLPTTAWSADAFDPLDEPDTLDGQTLITDNRTPSSWISADPDAVANLEGWR